MQFLLLKAVEQETPHATRKGIYKLLPFLPRKAKKRAAPILPQQESTPQSLVLTDNDAFAVISARSAISAPTLLAEIFPLLTQKPAETTLNDIFPLLPSTPTEAINTPFPPLPSSNVAEQE